MRPLDYVEVKKFIDIYKEKIINCYIEKIYYYNDFYVFLIRKKGFKTYLYIKPGYCLFLDNRKEFEKNNITKKLERFIKNRKILDICVLKGNRIVKISLKGIWIYIELFGGGNIIITDENNKILFALKYKDFGIRKIFKDEKYIVPSPSEDPFDLTYNSFLERMKKSQKKDIIRFLILDVNIGPRYAEEILNRCEIKKNIKPKEAIKYSEKIFKKIKEILNENEYLLYEDDFSFVKIPNKKPIKKFSDLNELLKNFYLKEKEKDYKEIILNEIEKTRKTTEFIKENIKILKFIYNELKNKKDIDTIKKEIKEYFGKLFEIERINKNKFKIKEVS